MNDDLRERFHAHVDTSAMMLARDLVSLLNRARALGIAIRPDVDPNEGISYSIEWAFGDRHRSLDVEWLPNSTEWTFVARQPEAADEATQQPERGGDAE